MHAKHPSMKQGHSTTISDERVAELMAIRDEDIDFSDIPEATEEQFKNGWFRYPGGLAVTLAELDEQRACTWASAGTYISVPFSCPPPPIEYDELGMRPMQTWAYSLREERHLYMLCTPASGKTRAIMFIALDKLCNQGLKQAIITVPDKQAGARFLDTPLSEAGFWADWTVNPRWHLCNAPSTAASNIKAVKAFLCSDGKALVCPQASFCRAMDQLGPEAFDNRLVAVAEYHRTSASLNKQLSARLRQLARRNKAHLVAMTNSGSRGPFKPGLKPGDEPGFAATTRAYQEPIHCQYLERLDIGYCLHAGPYTDSLLKALNPIEKTILHIPHISPKELKQIIAQLGDWQGEDKETGFQLVKMNTGTGRILRIANLANGAPAKRAKVAAALKNTSKMRRRDYVDLIITPDTAQADFTWIWCEHALAIGNRPSLPKALQLSGHITQDAPRKRTARFTSLVPAEKTTKAQATAWAQSLAARLATPKTPVPTLSPQAV